MKNSLTLIAAAFGLALAACAAESSDTNEQANDTTAEDVAAGDVEDQASTTTKYTYADTKPIIDSKCTGCHSKFKTLAGIKADKAKMLTEIDNGKMPQGNATWATTTSGKKVVRWLKYGSDLK